MRNIGRLFSFCVFVCVVFTTGCSKPEATPMKDGLHLIYETEISGDESGTMVHHLIFTQVDKKHFKLHRKTSATVPLMDEDYEVVLDRYFKDSKGFFEPGPTGGRLWIPPHELKEGKIKGYEVLREEKWRGYDVYVVKFLSIPEDIGYYEKTTGLLVGYINQHSSTKLYTVLVETNADGL